MSFFDFFKKKKPVEIKKEEIINPRKYKWGEGIPQYSADDIMSDRDICEFVYDYVEEYEGTKHGYYAIYIDFDYSSNEYLDMTLNANGIYRDVYVRYAIHPEIPILNLSYEQREQQILRVEEKGKELYFAAVSIRPYDEARYKAGLFLKNDDFEITYYSMEKIEHKKSKQWIETAISEIDDLSEDDYKPKTADTEERVRFSIDVSEEPKDRRYFSIEVDDDDFNEWFSSTAGMTFQEMLLDCIDRKCMSNQEFYRKALIDRKLFSAIKNNKNYQPKKETAVACCFGLELNLPDSEKLLEVAGYKLSLSITWDKVIYYCIKNRITDIDVVNELLYAKGEKCLRV